MSHKDRNAIVGCCPSMGGPFNCPYCAGILSDNVNDLVRMQLSYDNQLAYDNKYNNDNNNSYNGSNQYEDAYAEKVSILCKNIDKFLSVYTVENHHERVFYYDRENDNVFEYAYTDDDILEIRDKLMALKVAAVTGNYNGYTIVGCVKDLNEKVGVPSNRVSTHYWECDIFGDGSERTLNLQEVFHKNIALDNLVPGLANEINIDGSLDINSILSKEQQDEIQEWWVNQLSINDDRRLPPAGIYYVWKAKQLQDCAEQSNQLLPLIINQLEKDSNITHKKDWRISKVLLLDFLQNENKDDYDLLIKKLINYSVNWDIYIISNLLNNGKTVVLNTVRRTIMKNGMITYQVRLKGTNQVLVLTYPPNSILTEPILTIV